VGEWAPRSGVPVSFLMRLMAATNNNAFIAIVAESNEMTTRTEHHSVTHDTAVS